MIVAVTAGAGGLGLAVCTAYAETGAQLIPIPVAVLYNTTATAPKTAEDVALKHGVKCQAYQADVNVNGAFYTAQAVTNMFRKRGFKTWISQTDINSGPGPQYYASKSGVFQLDKSLAVEYFGFCRVNCVSPGYVQTRIMVYASPSLLRKWLGKTPARRFASPYELKEVYLFCASSASSYMTGSNLVIHGSFTLP